MYFFRATFADCSGAIEVGVSRKPADDLMQISAEKFSNLKQKEEYIRENVLFREIVLEAKTKEELVQGEMHTRYYVQTAKFVDDLTQSNTGLLSILKKDSI